LISLGTASTGSDRLFLSAVNPSIVTFSFRANDLGGSIVSPTGIKLTIDGASVPVTVSPKRGEATDVVHTRVLPFPAGEHTYRIEVKDTQGNTVVDTGKFTSAAVGVLTAAQQAVSVDKTKPGFTWRIVQNQAMTSTSLDDAELALVGTLKDETGALIGNLAEPFATGNALDVGVVDGATLKFQVAGTFNVNSTAGNNGGTFGPDDQMPGVPGSSGGDFGIVAELTTFMELPSGVVTLAIACDDRFRAQGGPIGKPADGVLLGVGDRELNGNTSTGLIRFFVQDAGIYPIRIVYQDNGGAAHIEVASVLANGDKVLVNDVETGSLKSYRSGVVPAKSTLVVVGAVPAPLSGLALTGVSVSEATKTITADIPATGAAGFLTIAPGVKINSITREGSKLVIKYQ